VPDAAERYNVSEASFYDKRGLHFKYLVEIDGRKKVDTFGYDAWLKLKDTEYELKQKTGLFIEWLKEEYDYTYTDMAKHSGVYRQGISEHELGVSKCIKFLRAYKHLIPAFDRYYGW